MRLLKRDSNGSFILRDFFNQATPDYAILSHLWGRDEVTFEDITLGVGQQKPGWAKLVLCASLALADGLEYIWIDTCCIDKTNSAELSEAINSIYAWFKQAIRCYVILSDVRGDKSKVLQDGTFQMSRWFTRGWTLQELIAPPSLVFYSADGNLIGDRSQLAPTIGKITGMPLEVLKNTKQPQDCSVPERMSWMKYRQTTLPEDWAYCLLGLFDVNMPLIYGEGRARALGRLQREISLSTNRSSGLRLIDVESNPLIIETFASKAEPQYAILSHTWGTGEVSFQDILTGRAEAKNGYKKLTSCCEKAARDGYKYLWVDTCCIDKTSSAELQEALCSMFKWYQQAGVCYAYLEDHTSTTEPQTELSSRKWFKRGWTLQELIAPSSIKFFDQAWIQFGDKETLCSELSVITGIRESVLRGAPLDTCSVAERMSWASSRSTTRTEDAAYSLMGIFDVFMPMLYGEGNRAFLRLQEEIMKRSEDYTMFAWNRSGDDEAYSGVFAESPADFSQFTRQDGSENGLGISLSHHNASGYLNFSPAMFTGRGVAISLPLLGQEFSMTQPESLQSRKSIWSWRAWLHRMSASEINGTTDSSPRSYLGLLGEVNSESSGPQYLCIWLERGVDGIFVRAHSSHVVLLPHRRGADFKTQTIYARTSLSSQRL